MASCSSTELTELFLRRIERLNPQLNAFLTVTSDEAMAAAREADRKIQSGGANGPLMGIPISVKDLEATKGIRSTMGSLAFSDTIPDMDSVVVERVRASGATPGGSGYRIRALRVEASESWGYGASLSPPPATMCITSRPT